MAVRPEISQTIARPIRPVKDVRKQCCGGDCGPDGVSCPPQWAVGGGSELWWWFVALQYLSRGGGREGGRGGRDNRVV